MGFFNFFSINKAVYCSTWNRGGISLRERRIITRNIRQRVASKGPVPKGHEIAPRPREALCIVGIDVRLRYTPQNALWVKETRTSGLLVNVPGLIGLHVRKLGGVFYAFDQTRKDAVFALRQANNEAVPGKPLPLLGKPGMIKILRSEAKNVCVNVPAGLRIEGDFYGAKATCNLVPLDLLIVAFC